MCTNKKCSRCKETKNISEFHKNPRRKNSKPTWSDYRSFCKVCSSAIQKDYKERNPHMWITTRYNVSKEVAHDLYLRSMKSCEICGKEWEIGTDKLCIDHCHLTGKVRGIVCKSCNHVLGHSKDSISTLENAILYLRERG